MTHPPARGRPRARTDDALRERLLSAAMDAFILKGFGKATTADIASAAGVSKRDLYRLFSDKRAIFAEVVAARRHLILDLPRPEGERLPPSEALAAIFRLDLPEREAAEREALLNLVSRESAVMPELNALLYDSGALGSRELLMDWLEAQMQAGAMPRMNTASLAGLLMDVAFGALLPHRLRKAPPDRARQAQEVRSRIEIVLRGLR